MRRSMQQLACLVLCLNLLACTTLQSLPLNVSPPTAATLDDAGVKPGDKLVLGTASQASRALKVTALQTDALVGIDEASQSPVRVPYADIVALQRQQLDGWRTGLVVLGVVLLLGAVVQALAVSKLINSTAASGL
jgi:hypothetical protein